MLSSINPFVERARNNRWWLTVAAHVVGAAAAGTLVGLVLGTVGRLALAEVSAAHRLAAGAVATVALAGFDLAGRRPPSWRRQVDEEWLTTYRGWVYGLGFGAQLGAGLMTHITTAAVYATGAWAVVSADPGRGALIGLVFGAGRGLTVLAAAPVVDADRLRSLFRQVARVEPIARAVTVTTMLGVGAAAAVVAV